MGKRRKKAQVAPQVAPQAAVATGFDISMLTGDKTTDKQSFSRIKRIYAKDGLVFMDVDSSLDPRAHGGAPLLSRVLSVKEAAERAITLNKMAGAMNAADYKMVMEIVDNTIQACREAQQQLLKLNLAPGEDPRVIKG